MTRAARTDPPYLRVALVALLATGGVSLLGCVVAAFVRHSALMAVCGTVLLWCCVEACVLWAHARTRRAWATKIAAVAFTLGCVCLAFVSVVNIATTHRIAELWERVTAGCMLLGVWCAVIALAGCVRFRTWWWHTAPWVGVACATMLVAAGLLSLVTEFPFVTLAAAIGVDAAIACMMLVAAAGAAAMATLPVLAWLDRLPRAEPDGSMPVQHLVIRLACPRCATAAEVPANRACACPRCRLGLRVEVKEPRCACGYLLHRLDGPVCPECGVLLTTDDQWAAAMLSSPREPPSPSA